MDKLNEQSVLGSVLLDSNRAFYVLMNHNVTVESFSDPEHRRIFTAMMELSKAGRPVDVTTMSKQMNADTSTLEEMIDKTPTAAHVEYYVKQLKEAEHVRQIEGRMIQVAEQIRDGATSTEAVESLNEVIMSVSKSGNISIKTMSELRDDKVEQWKAAQTHGFVGVPCITMPGVNEHLGGWRQRVMGLIAAYRSEGKSTLIRQECVALAQKGYKVALFTLEDPATEAAACIAGNVADVSTFGLDTGRCSPKAIFEVENAWKNLDDLPLWIIDSAQTMAQIKATMQLMKMRHNIDIAFVDHIQFISPYRISNSSRNDTVAQYSSEISQLAKALNIPVVCASQLSRDAEKSNRKPRLSDLRDSGTLEQDARQILLLYYDRDNEHHVLEVAKNNFGQSRKDVKIKRIDGRQRFEEMPPEEQDDAEDLLL